MQQGHLHLTKENFLSDTEREVNDSTHSVTEHFLTINKCYMFYHNFWRSSQTEIKERHKTYILSQFQDCQQPSDFFRNQSDRSPEQPRNSTSHYSNVRTGHIKYIFRIPGHQILTEVEQNHLDRKSGTATTIKSF